MQEKTTQLSNELWSSYSTRRGKTVLREFAFCQTKRQLFNDTDNDQGFVLFYFLYSLWRSISVPIQ